MSSGTGRQNTVPFPPEYRASGLLLHVTSLPSPYGIGDLGPEAFTWVDRLHDAGQKWWQALPLGPAGYGNSPYQPLSSFAGNALIISPQSLIAEGLLDPTDCHGRFAPGIVDYDSVIPFKERVLQTAWNRFQRVKRGDLRREYEEYCLAQASWLDDYALFRALKARHGGAYYIEWPAELMQRRQSALAEAGRELRDAINRVRFEQLLVSRQGEKLKEYAHAKGVTLIGDLPFFVSPDSSDVWATPSFFFWTWAADRSSWRGYLLITSARRASCGATPFTSGRRPARPGTDGGSTGFAHFCRMWTRFVSITSAGSRRLGTFRLGLPLPRQGHGSPVRGPVWSRCVR